jgi:predicted RNA-binding protein YlxR (DUF448 family)
MENKNKVKVNYSADELLRLNQIENGIRDKLHTKHSRYIYFTAYLGFVTKSKCKNLKFSI